MSQYRSCDRCDSPQTFHITDVSRAGVLTEIHVCEPCAYPILTKPYQQADHSSRPSGSAEVQVELERLVITEIYDQQALLLRESKGDRRCRILIGIFEATALDRLIKGFSAPRPLTHNAWAATIEALDATVRMVSITGCSEVLERTYLAELRLDRQGTLTCVDIRPSDAVLIATLSNAPIMMPDDLLTNADNLIEYGV